MSIFFLEFGKEYHDCIFGLKMKYSWIKTAFSDRIGCFSSLGIKNITDSDYIVFGKL